MAVNNEQRNTPCFSELDYGHSQNEISSLILARVTADNLAD